MSVQLFETKDLWFANRYKTDKDELVLLSDPEWVQEQRIQDLLKKVRPSKITSAQNVKIGDIYFNRNFSEDDKERLTGKGGHVNIVLGVRPSNGYVVTLGYNRALEKDIDGFAIQDYPYVFNAARESYCLEKIA